MNSSNEWFLEFVSTPLSVFISLDAMNIDRRAHGVLVEIWTVYAETHDTTSQGSEVSRGNIIASYTEEASAIVHKTVCNRKDHSGNVYIAKKRIAFASKSGVTLVETSSETCPPISVSVPNDMQEDMREYMRDIGAKAAKDAQRTKNLQVLQNASPETKRRALEMLK